MNKVFDPLKDYILANIEWEKAFSRICDRMYCTCCEELYNDGLSDISNSGLWEFSEKDQTWHCNRFGDSECVRRNEDEYKRRRPYLFTDREATVQSTSM